MTSLIRGTNSYFMGAQAFILDNERDTASSWASKYVQSNPAIKWILGRYAEADNPNNNRQAWALEDLRIAQPTIEHAPMNMLHQARNIVGSFVATEMIYPIGASEDMNKKKKENCSEGDVEDNHIQNPFVEALAAFWSYYFQEELALVQRAHDEGSLFFSMECVAETLTFESPSGVKETFPYKGPFDESYGDWNRAEAVRWLDNPHFLGGALILPPSKPGWSNADIKSLSKYVESHQEIAESTMQSVKAQVPHLSEAQIEDITLGLLKSQVKEETAELIGNSNSFADVSKDVPEDHSGSNKSDEVASDVSHSKGGDMDKKYTEEELAAAIAEAVAPLKVELEAVQAQANVDAIEARLEEATAEHVAELANIQSLLDAAVIEAEAAKADRDAIVAWLEETANAEVEAAEKAARAEARITAIKEVANFPEEYLVSNTDRWVEMSDDNFAATVEDYRIAAESAKAASTTETDEVKVALASTAMKAEREENGQDSMSGVRDLMRLSRSGFDPRTV